MLPSTASAYVTIHLLQLFISNESTIQNLLINFVGGLVMILWSAAVTLVAYILLRYLDMHRASINDETLGLDLAVHNEPAYNFTWEDIEIQFKTANANGKQQK